MRPAKPYASKSKAEKSAASIGVIDADKAASVRKVEFLAARLSELEDALLHKELDSSTAALNSRIKRLETDVETFREARTAAEFFATDFRASLTRSAVALERVKDSPAYRLGLLLIDARQNWRSFIRLPGSLIQWRRDAVHHREEIEAQLVQGASTFEFTSASERGLELAKNHSVQVAERWVIDQRFRAPVAARVLSDLANFARRGELVEAVRLAEAALEADPSESRVKRLAFLIAESGAITSAATLLRSAIRKGASLNGAEQLRSEEIFALADLALWGAVLLPKRRLVGKAPAGKRRVVILSTQSYPYHWSSVSIRTHSTAVALTDAGIPADVITIPGYPNIGRRDPVASPPTRNIEGVDYHVLDTTTANPGLGHDYIKQTSIMLASKLRKLGATILIAPADFEHAYIAAVASQIGNVSLILDCCSISPEPTLCITERSQILSRAENQVFQYATAILARTPAIAARLHDVAPNASMVIIPDFLPRTDDSTPSGNRAGKEEFVFGYVGDNSPDVDLESLANLLEHLVASEINARLVIYSVGARIQAIRDQLELQSLGSKVTIIEKSPLNRRSELAYNELDMLVVPYRLSSETLKSPFQIVSALRHGKCVIALGAAGYDDLFGDAIIHAGDFDSAAQTLKSFALDIYQRQKQEDRARAWDERHPSASLLIKSVEGV